MRRREFITLLGGAAASWPQTATSQNTGRVHRVGVLFAASGRGSVPDEAFRSGLRERGYIEGKNIVIEKADRLRGLEVHCQSKRRGLLDRQVADLLAAQDLSQLSGQLGGFPAISAAPGQFLLKDLVLLAASLSLLLASVQGQWLNVQKS